MKRIIVMLPLLLTACAKISDYQSKCEQQYSKLSDVAICLDSSVKNDFRMSGNPEPKLYVLAAKKLGEDVDQGKMSDAQARLELQNMYVNMQRQELTAQQVRAQAIQQSLINTQTINTMQAVEQKARQPVYAQPAQLQNNITTNCTRYGNQVTCNSY